MRRDFAIAFAEKKECQREILLMQTPLYLIIWFVMAITITNGMPTGMPLQKDSLPSPLQPLQSHPRQKQKIMTTMKEVFELPLNGQVIHPNGRVDYVPGLPNKLHFIGMGDEMIKQDLLDTMASNTARKAAEKAAHVKKETRAKDALSTVDDAIMKDMKRDTLQLASVQKTPSVFTRPKLRIDAILSPRPPPRTLVKPPSALPGYRAGLQMLRGVLI